MNAAFRKATKLTELATLAVIDLEAIIADKRYDIALGDAWHTGEQEDYDYDEFVNKMPPHTEKCAVCFAGAVMAQSLGVKITEKKGPEDFPKKVTAKLSALNSLRMGDINDALETLGSELRVSEDLEDEMGRDMYDVEDAYDRATARQFVKRMKKWIKKLERIGI